MAGDTPQVSVDRQGDALLVWDACDRATAGCYYEAQARRLPAGGEPEAIMTLSAPGTGAGFPDVDTDDDGDAAVVWATYGGASVGGRRISASGSLVGPVQTLSTSAPTTSPVVAVEPGGTALAAWSEIRDGSWYTVTRRFNDDGSIGPAITLGSGTEQPPDIGVDRDGRFVIAWVQADRVMAARLDADSVSSTQNLTAAIPSSGPFGLVRVGVDSDGDAVISYHARGDAGLHVSVSRWSRTGTVEHPINATSPTDRLDFFHNLATDLEGDSMLVWSRRNSDNRIEILGRQLSRTGTLGDITNLGEHDFPDIVLDDDGDGLMVFQSPSRPYEAHEVLARVISPSGSFGTTKTLSSDGRMPQVDASPSSRFSVIWQQASHPYTIHAATGS